MEQPPRTNWRRLLRLVTILIAIVISLLTFPSWIPVVMAVWITVVLRIVSRGESAWLPISIAAAIVLAKRIDWPPSLALLATLAVLTVSVGRRVPRRVVVAAWVVSWGLFAADWWRSSHNSRAGTIEWDSTRPIVCLGDSLTSGESPLFGYPKLLGSLVPLPVVDFGEAGIKSDRGVRRLPEILALKPAIVVIELGGHDFLQGESRSATQSNLETIIQQCRAAGAEVILMEIPRGFISDGHAGLERELARRYDLELISDGAIRQLVLWSPFCPPGMWLSPAQRLSDDGLHANARGNQALAEAVAAAVRRLIGSSRIETRRVSEGRERHG